MVKCEWLTVICLLKEIQHVRERRICFLYLYLYCWTVVDLLKEVQHVGEDGPGAAAEHVVQLQLK